MDAKHLALYFLLPLLVLGFVSWWIYGPSGAGSNLKKVTEKLKGFLPDVSLGAKRLEAGKPALPPYHEQAVRRLVDTIQTMLSSDRAHCFESYAGLPELKEKGGTIIRLSADTITTFSLGGRQEITDLNRELSAKLVGFKPCVVAGPAALKFGELFLNKEPWATKQAEIERQYYNRAEQPPFLVVEEIAIKYDSENKINFGQGDKDLEDYGILYSPVKGLVCFFPTFDGDNVCNADNEGLDDDCLGEDPAEDISLPRQLNEKKMLPCAGPREESSSEGAS